MASVFLVVGLTLLQDHNGGHYDWNNILFYFMALLILSLILILLSTFYLYKLLVENGCDRIIITFDEKGITLEDKKGTTSKDWDWIKEFTRSRNALFIRVKDGVLGQLYIIISRSSLPTADFAILDELITRNIR